MIIKDLRTLNAIAKKYKLIFDKKFKYYTGNPYYNLNNDYLPTIFEYKNTLYELKYFDGCINPYLIKKDYRSIVHNEEMKLIYLFENDKLNREDIINTFTDLMNLPIFNSNEKEVLKSNGRTDNKTF